MANAFQSLGIRPELVQQLKELGITQPTPIQKQAIPPAYAGKDVIAEAQTGTGKTLAFVLTMLERIRTDVPQVQGLILAPTRELAIQITTELKKLAPVTGANVLAAYGGQDVERQLRKLEGDVHIIVATPGRLLDHLRRGSVQLHKISMLVLDEADQMLHMGFLNEVEDIIRQIPNRRQTMLFSATMPRQVRLLAQQYMRQPEEISVRTKQVTLEEIEQLVIQTSDRGKQDALCKAIDEFRPYLAMIFCRTKRRAGDLNGALQERGYLSDELHGDLSQAKREQVMKRFREAKIQLLVATDVAARGLDVEGVTHVFNYDIPHDAEGYIHRIGRTGRAGQAGAAITFASPRDRYHLDLIEKGIRMTIEKRKATQLERSEDEQQPAERGEQTRKPRASGAGQRRGTAGAGATRRGAGRGAARGGTRGAARDGGRGSEQGQRGEARGQAGEAARGQGGGRGQGRDGVQRGEARVQARGSEQGPRGTGRGRAGEAPRAQGGGRGSAQRGEARVQAHGSEQGPHGAGRDRAGEAARGQGGGRGSVQRGSAGAQRAGARPGDRAGSQRGPGRGSAARDSRGAGRKSSRGKHK